MEAQPSVELDLDSEKVLFEGAWVDRQELAERIKHMIENGDFRISAVGNALEYLESSIRQAREFTVRLAGPDAEQLEAYAQENNLTPAAALRFAWQNLVGSASQVVQPVTAEQVPEASDASQITITTEPVQSAGDAGVVELTERKSQSIPKVVVDPSLAGYQPDDGGSQPKGNDAVLGDWFKR